MKNTLTISMLFLLLSLLDETYTSLCAQKITCQWSLGGSEEDYLGDVIRTSDNGFLIASTSISGISGDKTEKCFGDFDYWIIKSNKKGKIQWQRTFGGNKEDEPLAVLETQDGGYLICGSSYSGKSGNKTIDNLGDTDFWVVKLDKTGKEEWQKGYGRKKVEYLVAAMHYPDGGYLLAGYSWFEPADLPSGSQKGRYDYWLVLIDEKGEMKWEQSIGGNHDDMLTDAMIDKSGNVVLTGYSLSGAVGDKTEPCLGHFDFWTVCLNKERKIVWQKTLGSEKDDRSESVFQDEMQVYHIGGASPMNLPSPPSDFYVGMLNAKGDYVGKIQPGGNLDDYIVTVSPSFDKGIFYAGNSKSGKSGDKSEDSYGELDGWMIKYDAAGKKSWDKTIGGTKYDVINKILPIKGNCYNLFMTSESGKTGNLTQPGKGMGDLLVITIKDKMGGK